MYIRYTYTYVYNNNYNNRIFYIYKLLTPLVNQGLKPGLVRENNQKADSSLKLEESVNI